MISQHCAGSLVHISCQIRRATVAHSILVLIFDIIEPPRFLKFQMQFFFQALLYFPECHHKIFPIRATQKHIIHVHCLVAQQSDLDRTISA